MPKGDKEILKADPEDGTTPVANLLLEAIAISRLSGTEKGILLFLIRRTYGWLKDGKRLKETALSLTDCEKAFNLHRSTCHKVLESLAEKQIILRQFSKPGYGYSYQINTRVSEWDNSCINHQQLAELATGGLVKNTTVGLAKTLTPLATKSSVLKKNKEILNKEKISNNDKDAEKLWNTVLIELRGKMNPSNFETWLEDTVGVRFSSGQFVVGCPNDFVIDYLGKNQHSLIENTLTGLLGCQVKPVFVRLKE